MPNIEITSEDKRKIDELIQVMRSFVFDLPVDARKVFTIETIRLLKPEIDELKRQVQK